MRWGDLLFKHPVVYVSSWGQGWILKGSHTSYWLWGFQTKDIRDGGGEGWGQHCLHLNILPDLLVITSFKVQSPSKYYTRERRGEKKWHGSWPRTLIKVFLKQDLIFIFCLKIFIFIISVAKFQSSLIKNTAELLAYKFIQFCKH